MKKNILVIVSVIVSVGMNAQGIVVQDANDNTVATYGSTYKAVLKKTPSTSFNAAGHDYVEITNTDGSKTKWATMNIGAKTVAASAETCYGDYYAWGADKTWYTENIVTSGTVSNFRSDKSGGYKKANAPYYSGSAYTKYTGTGEGGDNKTKLEPMDDIAHLAWGGTWRMPTNTDFKNLFDACGGLTNNKWTETISSTEAVTKGQGVYWLSVAGCKVNSVTYNVVGALFVKDATHMVFFPASGCIENTSLNVGGSRGYYWSSSLYRSDTIQDSGQTLSFYSTTVNPVTSAYSRYTGISVRPVSE